MTTFVNVLAVLGALSLFTFAILGILLAIAAQRERKEEELKSFVANVIRNNPYLCGKLDTLELKQLRTDTLEGRYAALDSRIDEFYVALSMRLSKSEKDIEELKVIPV